MYQQGLYEAICCSFAVMYQFEAKRIVITPSNIQQDQPSQAVEALAVELIQPRTDQQDRSELFAGV